MWNNKLDSEFWHMCRVPQVSKTLYIYRSVSPHILLLLGKRNMWHKLKRTCDSFVCEEHRKEI